jgi:hypothetical protein
VTALRGPRTAALLARFGVDARRFWLLTDLFEKLAERGEMMDQLGRDGVALKVASGFYAAVTGVLSLVLALVKPTPEAFLAIFVGTTAFLLLTVLLSEAANSLLNPAEAMVLAHQPIDGATYTTAKLTHLGRIVLQLALATAGIPAIVGLFLPGARWWFPFLHLALALAVGALAALLCCALYGWLIRLVPAPRLKAIGQFAGALPLLAMMWMEPLRKATSRVVGLLPADPAVQWTLLIALFVLAAAVVVLGLRALSADYLIRVSAIVHSSRKRGARVRRSWSGALVARCCGGAAARAGFSFVSKMARRDFHFRRQAIPLAILIPFGWAPALFHDWRTSPFGGDFAGSHLLPHVVGGTVFIVCPLLAFAVDYKGAWVFQLAPVRAFRGFARGVWAAVGLPLVAIPHALFIAPFAWAWGVWPALLFFAYSAALACAYLALSLRLIDGIPFSRPADPKRGAIMLPALLVAGAVVGIAVSVQYFWIFRSVPRVIGAAVVLAGAAYWLTRSSLRALEAGMRHHLATLSDQAGDLYREVDV